MTEIAETEPVKGAADRSDFNVSTAYRNYVLGLLMVVGVFNFVDRQIFAILLESIRAEFNFSDTQLGLLGGIAFGLLYAIAGLPIAWMADKSNRRNIIAIALTVWSFMTALCGLANSFLGLFLARMGVGIGEAGGNPPSQSLVSDYFPTEKRGTALAVLNASIPVGTLVGFLVGGWANQFLGWRATLLIVGLPGIILALILRLTLREPPRGHSEKGGPGTGSTPSILATARYFIRTPSLRHLPIAGALFGLAAWGATTWMPAFFIRVHGMSSGAVGSWLALLIGASGIVGTLSGGYITDRVVKKTGDERWYMWISAGALFVATPFAFIAYLSPTVEPALASLVIPMILANFYIGPTAATIMNLAGPWRRSMAAALFLFLTNLISMGAGPLVVGIISDLFSAEYGVDSLRYSLLTLVIIANFWAALHFFLAARTLREDLAAARRDT